MTCENCAGEGGWEADDRWIECPACRGSGWVEGEADSLDIDDLDLRAPLDSLLEAWRDLADRGDLPGVRRRIAGVCDRRLLPQYRAGEC